MPYHCNGACKDLCFVWAFAQGVLSEPKVFVSVVSEVCSDGQSYMCDYSNINHMCAHKIWSKVLVPLCVFAGHILWSGCLHALGICGLIGSRTVERFALKRYEHITAVICLFFSSSSVSH